MRIIVKTFTFFLVVLTTLGLSGTYASAQRTGTQESSRPPDQLVEGMKLEALGERAISAIKEGNLAEVKRLVELEPALIRAFVDINGGNMSKIEFYGEQVELTNRVNRERSRFTVFDDRGGNLLHIAAAAPKPNIDIVKFLIESGIDIKKQNNEGFEPLLIAILAENWEAAYYIHANRQGNIETIGGSGRVTEDTIDKFFREYRRMGYTASVAPDTLVQSQTKKRNTILDAIYALQENLKKLESTKRGDISLVGHTRAVESAIFLPDGKRVLTTDGEPTFRIWDAETGKELSKFDIGSIGRYAFSPDGKKVVTTPYDRGLIGNKSDDDITSRIWDVESGKVLVELGGDKKRFDSITFSPDGKKIAATIPRQPVRIWDAESGKELRKLGGDTNHFSTIIFSPDGKRILTEDISNIEKNVCIIQIWDVDTGKELLKDEIENSYSFRFSPDGKKIVTQEIVASDQYGRVTRVALRIWDAESGKELQKKEWYSRQTWSANFSPDGKRIVVTGEPAQIWDVESGKELLKLRGSEGDRYSDVAHSAIFSPDGKKIATHFSRTARIFDAETGKELQKLEGGHEDSIESVAFSPDGKKLVTGSKDKTARIWILE